MDKITKERFIPNPFRNKPRTGPDNRIYETGDMARIREDGSLEVRGRYKDFVKIRGKSVMV